MLRINLISNPRNLSTALMYAFAQRVDTCVVYEPFYGFYLASSGAQHPGREEIMHNMETDPEKICDQLKQDIAHKDVLFIKNMAHHLSGITPEWWLGFRNVLYIRNPRQVISSFAKVMPDPGVLDVGFLFQYEIFKFLRDRGHPPVVLDSGILLANPRETLRLLCQTLDIPFYEEMLHWRPGPRKEDGPWAKYWYRNVQCSTGFVQQTGSNRPLPPQCQSLYETCLPWYEKLLDHALKP